MTNPPSLDDLSAVPLGDVLDAAEQRLARRLDRARGHYSSANGTAGFPTETGTWVRLAWRRTDRMNTTAWTGLEAAAGIQSVPRPQWYAAAVWHDPQRGVVWRADEMTLAIDAAISAKGTTTTDPGLPENWWKELHTALRSLAEHRTDRVSLAGEHVAGRIREVYGDHIDTAVTTWATAHGDLGWANLCGPTLTILDWESWGAAPVGWDAAALWAASLPVPRLAEKVRETFAAELSTRSGQLCQLLLCANTARAHRRTSTTSLLTEPMAKASDELLASLA